MNYWLAESCNLSECHGPLFDLIEGLSKTGPQNGRSELQGRWMGVTSQCGSMATIRAGGRFRQGRPDLGELADEWPVVCAHLWEHYLFTRDENFLGERVTL